MQCPRILAVTGASGVGKTTLVRRVESRGVPGVSFHYFDSIGVPPLSEMVREYGSAAGWQDAMTDRWVQRLASGGNELCVLDGQVRPTALRNAFARHHVDGHVLLVDCLSSVREARLRDSRHQPELATATPFPGVCVNERSPNESERKVLTEPDAARVLSRAIELEHLRAAGSTVADLRAAAGEVGVSAGSFDAALAELDVSEKVQLSTVGQRVPRRIRLSAIAAAAIALIAFFVFMRIPAAAVSSVPMVEQAVVLRCLSADEAAQLIRPLLNLPANSLVARKADVSRVLTIRATPEQWQKIRSLLDEQERAGSAACTTRPTPPAAP